MSVWRLTIDEIARRAPLFDRSAVAVGNFEGVQLMFAGSESAQEAAANMEKEMDRIRTIQPDLIDNFKEWAAN